jgi:hypothetical protein
VTGPREFVIGGTRYRTVVSGREGHFVACAERADTGERFGVECSGVSEADAVDRLARWIEWQHDHAAALEALQHAERAYHRTIAGSAFVSPIEGPSAAELQQDALDLLKAARQRLDDVRAREPRDA